MRRQIRLLLTLFVIVLSCSVAAKAQVASGGGYTLDQAVIAGGGTSADAGNTYSITGAIGQAVTDSSSAGSFTIKSGFFTAVAPLAPTAAVVSVSGRVLTADGRGIRNVILILTDLSGSLRTATTTAFGYYRFSDVSAGGTYTITARGKRFTFASPTQVVNVNDDATDVNFIGIPAQGLKNFE